MRDDKLNDGELDELKCMQKIRTLPVLTKMWQIRWTDVLNDDELDEFYCSSTFFAINYIIYWSPVMENKS